MVMLIGLQRYVQAPESGAAVVMDAFNGDVLALASTPGFDQTHSRAD